MKTRSLRARNIEDSEWSKTEKFPLIQKERKMSVSVLAAPPTTKPTKSPKTKRIQDVTRSCDEVSLSSINDISSTTSIAMEDGVASPEKRERRRSRSNSVRGSIRLQFRAQLQLEALEQQEATQRGAVELQSAKEFTILYRYAMLPQLEIAEVPQRLALEKQEECERAVILRQRGYMTNPDVDREVSVAGSLAPAENRLYDRMMRKRRELGLTVDPNTTAAIDSSKDAQMSQLAKQSAEQDLAATTRDLAHMSVELADLEESIRTQKNKARKQTLEAERQQKIERINKLKELLEHRSACVDEERRRMSRVANLNVDKDVLLGKKSTETAKRQAAEEKRREQLEKEVDEALRRALLTEKMETRSSHSELVRLPSIVKIVSDDDQRSAARVRRRSNSTTSAMTSLETASLPSRSSSKLC